MLSLENITRLKTKETKSKTKNKIIPIVVVSTTDIYKSSKAAQKKFILSLKNILRCNSL